MRFLKLSCVVIICLLLSACGNSEQFLIGEITSVGNTCFTINCSGSDTYLEEFEIVTNTEITFEYHIGDKVKVWYEEQPEGSLPATVIATDIKKLK